MRINDTNMTDLSDALDTLEAMVTGHSGYDGIRDDIINAWQEVREEYDSAKENDEDEDDIKELENERDQIETRFEKALPAFIAQLGEVVQILARED